MLAAAAGCGSDRAASEDAPALLERRAPDGVLSRPELQRLVEAGLARQTPILMEALDDADPVLRARAAYALASVQDPAAAPALQAVLADPDARVRQDAAFALGQLGDPANGPALLAALADEEDAIARRLLLEALGKSGDADALVAVLEHEKSQATALEARGLALALNHFGRRGVVHADAGRRLVELVETADDATAEVAARALAEPGGVGGWGVGPDRIRDILSSMNRRRTAAGPLLRIVGAAGGAEAPAILADWLERAGSWRTRVDAALAAGRGMLAAADTLRAALRRALDDPSVHVAVAAAQVLAAAGPRDDAEGLDWSAWIRAHPERPVVVAALLPGLVGPAHRGLVLEWVRGELGAATRPALAYPALGRIGGAEADALLLLGLGGDRRDAYIAAEALAYRLRDLSPDHHLWRDVPALLIPRLAHWGPFAPMSDLRGLLQLVGVLLERGSADDGALLAAAARHAHPRVRALARDHGAASIAIAAASPIEAVDWDRLAQLGPKPRLRFETPAGPFVVELDAEAAPLSVSALARWADSGMFSGLPFHRVEPGFILQSGDFLHPEGFGGPDRGLVSEFTRIAFDRGVLGMASAGKDSEGSQYFITHGPAPSLDGRYGAIGRVVEGLAAADAVVLGDPAVTVMLEHGDSPEPSGR